MWVMDCKGGLKYWLVSEWSLSFKGLHRVSSFKTRITGSPDTQLSSLTGCKQVSNVPDQH